jgi:hypothetical protein
MISLLIGDPRNLLPISVEHSLQVFIVKQKNIQKICLLLTNVFSCVCEFVQKNLAEGQGKQNKQKKMIE